MRFLSVKSWYTRVSFRVVSFSSNFVGEKCLFEDQEDNLGFEQEAIVDEKKQRVVT